MVIPLDIEFKQTPNKLFVIKFPIFFIRFKIQLKEQHF